MCGHAATACVLQLPVSSHPPKPHASRAQKRPPHSASHPCNGIRIAVQVTHSAGKLLGSSPIQSNMACTDAASKGFRRVCRAWKPPVFSYPRELIWCRGGDVWRPSLLPCLFHHLNLCIRRGWGVLVADGVILQRWLSGPTWLANQTFSMTNRYRQVLRSSQESSSDRTTPQ